MRRPPRPDRPHRLPRRDGRHLPVADAVLPVRPARRRLRHHRLLRGRPAPRHPRRPGRDGPHRQRPRHPRHRRPRGEPHLRPSTRGSRPRARTRDRRSTTGTSGATRSRARSPATWSSPTRRTRTGRTTARRGQWYLHRFYRHQPDLNVANPEVRDEIAQIVGFWLEQGLGGFRVDAVPFLIEPTGCRGRDRGPARAARRPARLPRPPPRRRDAAGRGQPAAAGPGAFFGDGTATSST